MIICIAWRRTSQPAKQHLQAEAVQRDAGPDTAEAAASTQTTEAARLSVQQWVLGTNNCEHVCNAHRLQTLKTKQRTPVGAARPDCPAARAVWDHDMDMRTGNDKMQDMQQGM